jgi:hypothetical protein
MERKKRADMKRIHKLQDLSADSIYIIKIFPQLGRWVLWNSVRGQQTEEEG